EIVNNLLTQFKKGYLNKIESDYSFLSENDKKNFPFYKAYDYLGLIILNIGKINEHNEYIVVITKNIENQYIKETQINTLYHNDKKMISDRNKPEDVSQYLLSTIDLNNKKFSYVKFGVNYELETDIFGFKSKLLAKEHYDEIYKD